MDRLSLLAGQSPFEKPLEYKSYEYDSKKSVVDNISEILETFSDNCDIFSKKVVKTIKDSPDFVKKADENMVNTMNSITDKPVVATLLSIFSIFGASKIKNKNDV